MATHLRLNRRLLLLHPTLSRLLSTKPPPSLDDIRQNLSQYRRPDPPPPPSSPPPFSFSGLYDRPDPESKMSFDTIRASLKDFRSPNPNPKRPVPGTSVIGGGEGFQFSLFGEQNNNERGSEGGDGDGVELLKKYTHVELGERLRGMGEGDGGDGGGWVRELGERVRRLREVEEKERAERSDGRGGGGFMFDHLRKSLEKLNAAGNDKSNDNLGKCECECS